MKTLILASGSPRRKELLSQIGLSFQVLTYPTDETIGIMPPEDAVMELAGRKAAAVLAHRQIPSDAFILGADTIVYHNGQILGKPSDEADAFRMLKSLSGDTHQVYTGVAILKGQTRHIFCECTEVSVCPMSDDEIRCYIATGDCMDKAGSYGIQGPFAAYISGIRGDYNNVVGLPVSRVYHELKNIGFFLD